ncbi:MAG: ssl1498 family light-harvesting-like protein [Hydrococcus sp. SU_1_0]|nr:ssl1498 family light-harvesting-like protein [Hydrococcus sp. SU_1_0]
MTTTTDESGIMNNFAQEPKMYYAEAPTSQEKASYILWGAYRFSGSCRFSSNSDRC